jgi:hypothetical protein
LVLKARAGPWLASTTQSADMLTMRLTVAADVKM